MSEWSRLGLPGWHSEDVACQDCGEADANVFLSGVHVCDRCADRRISHHTGFPRLPAPPPPIVLTGRDWRRHHFKHRIWRAATGIEVQLDEVDPPDGEGYEFAVLGDHDADVNDLVRHVQEKAGAEIGRQYLEPASHRRGWLVNDEVAGRFVWSDDHPNGRPYSVVVDGRLLTWEEFGEALESYEGWRFRLVLEDRVDDARVVEGGLIDELLRSGQFDPE